jgi:cell division protease FtsH
MTKRQLESQISTLFGGRLAEELIFGPESVTTGASNDIERATEIARNMVTRWGLSDGLGPLAYSDDEGEVFLGRAVTQTSKISARTARSIDQEIRAIIDRNYQRSKDILQSQMDKLHAMAEALIQYETISLHQIDDIMAGRPVRAPEDEDSGANTKGGAGGATTGERPAASGPKSGPGHVGGPVGEH